MYLTASATDGDNDGSGALCARAGDDALRCLGEISDADGDHGLKRPQLQRSPDRAVGDEEAVSGLDAKEPRRDLRAPIVAGVSARETWARPRTTSPMCSFVVCFGDFISTYRSMYFR